MITVGTQLLLDAKGQRTFTDGNGDLVTVSLKGCSPEWSGTLYFAHGGQCDASRIVLVGTTEKSSLTITTRGSGSSTTLGGIDTSDCPIGRIVAPTTELTGSVSIVRIEGPSAAVSLTFDRVKDANITSGMSIKSLKVTEWIDGDGLSDMIYAPSLGKLQVKGDKKRSLAGDFQADLHLSGLASFSKPILGSVSIAGNLCGASWNINGAVAGIKVAGEVGGMLSNDAVTIRSEGSMGAITVGAVCHADFLAGVIQDVTRHAIAQSDVKPAGKSIASFTVKPAKGSTGLLVVDGNLSAASVGAVKLVNTKFNNDQAGLNETEDDFGIWSGTVKSVQCADTTDPRNKVKN
jgi:hypothetical protein